MSDVATAKKQEMEMSRAMSSDAVRNADDCVRALERALESMQPPVEVFAGILRLIAEYVPYGELSYGSVTLSRRLSTLRLPMQSSVCSAL